MEKIPKEQALEELAKLREALWPFMRAAVGPRNSGRFLERISIVKSYIDSKKCLKYSK